MQNSEFVAKPPSKQRQPPPLRGGVPRDMSATCLTAWPTSVYLFVSPLCTMTYRVSWLRWPWPVLCRHQLLQHAVAGHAASAAQLPPAVICKPRTVRVNAYTPSLGRLRLEPEYQMSVVQITASDKAVEPRPIFSLRLSLVGLSLKNRLLY